MKPPRGTRLLAGLLLSAVWAGLGAGCEAEAMDQALPAEKLGSRSVVFFLPDYRLAELGGELLAALEDRSEGSLRAQLPQLTGDLYQEGTYQFAATEISLPLSRVEVTTGPGGLMLSIALAAGSGSSEVLIRGTGTADFTCRADLTVPLRQTAFHAALGPDESGWPALLPSGVPGLEGSPITVTLDESCPQQLPVVQQVLAQALEDAMQAGLDALVGDLSRECGRMIGANAGLRGRLNPNLALELLADSASSTLADEECRLGLAGGFQSQRASCVPADLPESEPVDAAAATFEQVLPGGHEPYRMAMALSLDYLRQAIRVGYRAGMLCRRVAQGDLPGIDLSALLPSLADLGAPTSVRAAVWPRGELSLEFSQPLLDEGENLPRLKLSLSDLYVDIYGRLDGADLRLLGLAADLTVHIGSRIEQGQLRFWLAEAQVTRLDILFDALLAEKAGTLRTAATEALRQVAAAWIDSLGPLPLALPTGAGDTLREFRLGADQLILYF